MKMVMKRILFVLLVSLGLQTQAQQSNPAYFCCDSITYWTDQSQGFNIGLDTTGMVHNLDSLEVWWAVCTNGLCYSGSGMYDYFPQVMLTDTLKVCYDVYLYTSNVVEVCTHCDSLIFDQNTFSWILFSMSQPVGIEEVTTIEIVDNKMYDVFGRELLTAPIGQMYIQNKKKYIKLR